MKGEAVRKQDGGREVEAVHRRNFEQPEGTIGVLRPEEEEVDMEEKKSKFKL